MLKKIYNSFINTLREAIRQSENLRNISDVKTEPVTIIYGDRDDETSKLASLVIKRDIAIGESPQFEKRKPELIVPEIPNIPRKRRAQIKRKTKKSLSKNHD